VRHILLVLERGGGLGHLAQIIPVARALKRFGVRLTFASVQPELALNYGPAGQEKLFQALVSLERYRAPSQTPLASNFRAVVPRNFSEVLALGMCSDVQVLSARMHGYVALFKALSPDAVLCHHSPIAHLVAGLQGIPKAAFGDGFCVPAIAHPMPCFKPNHSSDEPQSKQSLNAVEHVLNEVILKASCTFTSINPGSIQDWLTASESYLCTFPFFDHYGPRVDEYYYGGIVENLGKRRLEWPSSRLGLPKVLIYLSQNHSRLPALMQALGRLEWPSILFSVGLPTSSVVPPNVLPADFAMDLPWHLQHTDLFISHSPFGSSIQAMLAGVPILALPETPEQGMLTRQLLAIGNAAYSADLAAQNQTEPELIDQIESFLLAVRADDAQKSRAIQLAQTLRQFDPIQASHELAEDMLSAMF
jgi:hypothetical protein